MSTRSSRSGPASSRANAGGVRGDVVRPCLQHSRVAQVATDEVVGLAVVLAGPQVRRRAVTHSPRRPRRPPSRARGPPSRSTPRTSGRPTGRPTARAAASTSPEVRCTGVCGAHRPDELAVVARNRAETPAPGRPWTSAESAAILHRPARQIRIDGPHPGRSATRYCLLRPDRAAGPLRWSAPPARAVRRRDVHAVDRAAQRRAPGGDEMAPRAAPTAPPPAEPARNPRSGRRHP